MLNLGRSKKRSSGYRLDSELRHKVLKRDGHKCRYCGATYKHHVDHVKPRSRGGKDTMSNLVTACANCNLSKGARELPGIRTSTKIKKYSKERKKLARSRPVYTITERARPKRHWWALWIR
jgi:5-methylcytosine-specific restriction endonuclease McrA